MSNRPEPYIPLSAAEMLFVVLDTARQSGQLDERTKENVGLILKTYRVRVTAAIGPKGYDEIDVRHYTEAAAEALANWLDDRALKADLEDETIDFAEFERDFGEQQAQDQDQGTDEGGQPKVQGDDRARGTHYEAPPRGQRAIGSGEADPGITPDPA